MWLSFDWVIYGVILFSWEAKWLYLLIFEAKAPLHDQFHLRKKLKNWITCYLNRVPMVPSHFIQSSLHFLSHFIPKGKMVTSYTALHTGALHTDCHSEVSSQKKLKSWITCYLNRVQIWGKSQGLTRSSLVIRDHHSLIHRPFLVSIKNSCCVLERLS